MSSLPAHSEAMPLSFRPTASMPLSLALRQQQLQHTQEAQQATVTDHPSGFAQCSDVQELDGAIEGSHSTGQPDNAPQHTSAASPAAGPIGEGRVAPEPCSLLDASSSSFEVRFSSKLLSLTTTHSRFEARNQLLRAQTESAPDA